MPDSSDHNPQRLEQLLIQLTETHQGLSQSLTHLTATTERLVQNLNWVDGRVTILDESQNRLAKPEMILTQTIQESGPDLMATLMMQRAQLKLRSRSLSNNFQQDWLEHSSRRGQPKTQSD